MKKQIFALVLLSILILSLITGCTTKSIEDDTPKANGSDNITQNIADDLGEDLINENNTIELGELI
jgi:ABC-type Fe3+-hydroxamate transport system substrate-binding protein